MQANLKGITVLTETKSAGSRPMTLAEWGMLLLLGTIWGGSFFFSKIAIAEIPPVTLVFWRVAIAAAAINLYLAIRNIGLRPIFPLAGSFVVLAALNNVVPFGLIFLGQTEIGAGLASVLNATTPFWTILLARIYAREEGLSANKIAGVVVGIAGTAVMLAPAVSSGLGAPLWSKLVIIGAAVSYAISTIFAKRFTGIKPPLIAAGQLSMSTLLALPLMLLVDGAGATLNAGTVTWLCILMSAIPCTAFAYILYFNLISSAGASNTALVTLVVPASALLLGAAFLGETLATFEIAGMATIALGLIIIDGRIFTYRPRRSPGTRY